MKRLAIAALLIAMLPLSAEALASPTPTGTYTTTIKNPAAFKGTWVLNLARGGTYMVDNGQLRIRGKYTTTGTKIRFGHETGERACAKTGTYTWKKTGKTLRFSRVSESPACPGRSGVLAHTFTRRLR